MNKRFVAATILALAVLFSQDGGSVLATICPHLRSLTMSACHDMPGAVAGEHEMDHSAAEVTTEQASGKAVETNDPSAPCGHCAVHSRNKSDDSALQQPNLAKRVNDLTAFAPLSIVDSAALPTVTWVAKAHGPPGDNGRLHVLINVFRI